MIVPAGCAVGNQTGRGALPFLPGQSSAQPGRALAALVWTPVYWSLLSPLSQLRPCFGDLRLVSREGHFHKSQETVLLNLRI